jgi:hypothetical protein
MVGNVLSLPATASDEVSMDWVEDVVKVMLTSKMRC